MLKLLKTPPWNDEFGVACSGGLDSMTAAHFCVKGGRRPYILFFHHGIPEDEPGYEIVAKYAYDNKLTLLYDEIDTPTKKGLSQEEHWRIERYKFLNSFDFPIFTGHHLDDVMETWIFSSLHGMPKLIPFNTNNIYRPFMLNTKEELKEWALNNNVEWHEDELNLDTRFARCRIRHNILPEALKINPGLGTMLRKKLISKFGK
jgi:tRNA(Ile)-lysidine synthase